MKPWGGRFREATDPRLETFASSLDDDALLVRDDVLGSLAHVAVLEQADLLTDAEARELRVGLGRVLADLEDGAAPLDPALEDVHMNVEHLLGDEAGDAAGKLHAGRSRNDQVALDQRLWTRRAALDLALALQDLVDALLTRAEEHAATPMAGTTHHQPAQPVTLGYHLGAHAERFLRDARRALAAAESADVSPLGAAALAGTTLPTDPQVAADALGFGATFRNGLDAVGDRDFAAEALFTAALAGAHLAGLGEELVLWSTPQYGYVTLPEPLTTGSSIMPQKRNPDAAELLRGLAAPAAGDLQALLGILAGLPPGYHRDLQEAKTPLLRRLPRVAEATDVAAALVSGATFHGDAMAGHLVPELLATDLAEALVLAGVPFREAHHRVGELVAEAEDLGVPFTELAPERFPQLNLKETLDMHHAIHVRTHGTSPANVRASVAAARRDLEALQERAGALAETWSRAEATLLGGEQP